MPDITVNTPILVPQTSQTRFQQFQANKSNEIKAIATRFALNEMKLNRWWGSEKQWEEVYQTVWVEKAMQVELAYNVEELLNISRDILSGQQKIITAMGVIVSNTGQILHNQTILITNQGLILDITGQVLDVALDIQETSYQILGTVQDIQGTVNDINANGVHIASNNWSGGAASTKNYIWYVVGGLVALLVIFIILKMMKGKGKGRKGKK